MLHFLRNNVNVHLSERSDGNSRDPNNPIFKNFFFVKQVHGNDIYVLENQKGLILSRKIEADGIITDLPNIKIAIELADCNGLSIRGKKYVAAIHAGWKWLYLGIIPKIIKILLERGENPSSLHVFVGPSIRSCCYEVGEEFLGYFWSEHFQRNTNDKLHLDMISIMRNVLEENGIPEGNIEIMDICTMCGVGYFSHRREGNGERFIVGTEILSE